MTLRSPVAARAWTVEVSSHTGSISLICRHCPHDSGRLSPSSARAAALAHLARHARADLRDVHLRICQCRERGCRWHPRHRGCAGPIRLLLTRERAGRVWRLTDACTACAAATHQAAVVPDTMLVTPRRTPQAPRPRRREVRGPGDRHRVAEILSYLAAALPAGVSADARLIALQCSLRMDLRMQVRLPAGVLRSLRLTDPQGWQELEQACWLSRAPDPLPNAVVAELRDPTLLGQSPSRPDRRRAADWALRAGREARAARAGALLQLMSVYVAAHSDPAIGRGLAESERIARECGTEQDGLPQALACLEEIGVCQGWRICAVTGDVQWTCGRGDS